MLPLDLRDSVIRRLHETSDETEKVILRLAESIPTLVAELRKSLANSRENVSCFSGSSSAAACSDSDTLRKALRRTIEIVSQGSIRFRDLYEKDAQLFAGLEKGLKQLDTISRTIGSIKLDSEDMELISLNAMTVALKAGNSGRAFSFITEELKRLSARTITLVNSIAEQGESARNDFDLLGQSLADARTFQESLFTTFETRVSDSAKEFEQALDGMYAGLADIQMRSEHLTEPVGRVMESIQLQDIIRQSIDHIVIALGAIEKRDKGDEAWIDELAFARQVPKLADALIRDVVDQIRTGITHFQNLIDEAERQVQEIESERKQFVAGLVTVQGSSVSIDQEFRSASDLMSSLLDDLQKNVVKKQALVDRSGRITGGIQKLEYLFQAFDPLIMRFHSIDIASRIEVAKQIALQQMSDTVQEMSKLTKKIEQDVGESLEATQGFIRSTNGIIRMNQTLSDDQRDFVDTFSTEITESRSTMEEGVHQVHVLVSNFSLFTGGFIATFDKAKSDLKALEVIATQLEGESEVLARMQKQIDRLYEDSLKEAGMDEWTVTNDRLKEIIQRFTIFTHKQHAGDIAGFEVETGVDSGEITLF